MTFPTPQSALDYLQSKITEFYRQSSVLVARLNEVSKLKAEAITRNDQETAGKLIVMHSQVRQLLDEQVQLEIKLQPFVQAFGFTGLSGVPLVLIPVAIGVASLLYVHFQKIQAQKQALDMIKAGMLSPSQAEGILSTGLDFSGMLGGLSGLLVPGAVLFGLYIYFGMRRIP